MTSDATNFTANRRGFTLIEIMVVVTIIIVLMGILIPTLNKVFSVSNKSAAAAQLAAIKQGLQLYYADFHMYPPSAPSYGGITANRGSAMLAQGLQGYLPYAADGAGAGSPNNPPDPTYGFRIRKPQSGMGGGQIYGPYVPPDASTLKVSGTDQYFVDPWGNEILYYCSTLSTNATAIFGTSGGYYFNANDNLAASPSASPPNSGAFFAQINGGNGTNTPTGGVTGAGGFLLISDGPDGLPFSGDEVVAGN